MLYNISYLIFGLLAVSLAIARTGIRGVKVTRQPKYTRLPAGDEFQETITVENLSLLPKLWVTFHDHSTLPGHRFNVVVPLAPRQRRQWLLRTVTTVRGQHRIGPLEIGSGDPFGIFHAGRPLPDSYRVLVYPRMEDVPVNPFTRGPLVGRRAERPYRTATSQSVVSVRDYQPGDSLSKISWKATARVGRLMAKEFEPDPSGDLWLVLDLCREAHWPKLEAARAIEQIPIVAESTEEAAVTAAASLARRALLDGRAVGLIACGQRPEVLPPQRGIPQLQRILEILSSIRAVGDIPLDALLLAYYPVLGTGHLTMVITPDPARPWADLLASSLSPQRVSAVLIDRRSFGAPPTEGGAEATLASVGVRYCVVKWGIPLGLALSVNWNPGSGHVFKAGRSSHP